MKKIFLALVMAGVLLTGCGSSNKEEMTEAVESMENISVADVYDTISALTQTKMVEINDNLFENYFGINSEDFSEYVFAQSEDPTSAETIIIAKAKENVDISGYENNIENVIEQKTAEMNNYNLPEQVKLIENAEMKFNDDSMYIVIADKAEIMAETIEKGLGI